jgi:hypothetical protein
VEQQVLFTSKDAYHVAHVDGASADGLIFKFTMRIKLGELKNLIREVAISPSLKNNKLLNSPLDNKIVADLIKRLGDGFEQALVRDTIIRAMDKHYNPETRELDDKIYDEVMNNVKSAKEKMIAGVSQSVEDAWSSLNSGEQSNKKVAA